MIRAHELKPQNFSSPRVLKGSVRSSLEVSIYGEKDDIGSGSEEKYLSR